MQVSISSTLTILHDGQFWIGICERRDGALYGACRFVCGQWGRLDFRMCADGEEEAGASAASAVAAGGRNPKRAQREARKTLEAARHGVGTKAQQALAAAYEERKEERRADARTRREAEARRVFELRTAKRKRKHRGR